jgi:type II secretory pathway component GspD/PulD (secretin)
MAVDAQEGSLVVSGLPEDHVKIKATIDQMDREDAEGQRPALKVHRVTVGSVTNVYRSLAILFRDDTTVQLSLDMDNDAVIAVAAGAKQERIAELIKSIEDAARQDAQSTIELYSLRNVDSDSALEILEQMLDKQGSKADLSLDELSNQLVAIARPEVHEQITKLLEQLRGEEPELEIYDLKYVDPTSAETAILRQFADDGAGAPGVDIDPLTQQLFVSATAEQQQKIRELLIKMGETSLALLRGRSSQNMRTVPFRGDAKAALEEVRRIWPKLRDNEIRVISPDQPLPPQAPAETKPAAPNKSTSQRAHPPFATELASVVQSCSPPRPPSPFQFISLQSDESPDDKPTDEPAAPPDDRHSKVAPAKTTTPPPPRKAPSDAPTPPPASQPSPTSAPIYVVPSDGSITIVCDDPEALEQFEKLLRAMSGSTGEIGRNISVYELKHSNAVEMAEKLRELYDTRRTSWRLGTTEVTIVPDERLNRILVQGNRIDRETIEGLIRVLDTEEGTASKPQIVPVRFAEATEVAEVVREVFRSQMNRYTGGSSGSTRSSARSHVTPEVAVDPATNSLIVMAPAPLLDEILKLITSLDEAAEENPARHLKIIALQKTNATRVEEALQRILKSSSPRSPRPSR